MLLKYFHSYSFGTPCAILILCFSVMISDALAQERRAIPSYNQFGETVSESTMQSITSFIARYKLAWSKQDATSLSKMHSIDTEWTNAFARIIQGREKLREFLNDRLFKEFSQQVAESEMEKLQLVSSRYISKDTVIIHLVTNSHRGMARDGTHTARRTHIHIVVNRLAANINKPKSPWQIVHTVIMDAR